MLFCNGEQHPPRRLLGSLELGLPDGGHWIGDRLAIAANYFASGRGLPGECSAVEFIELVELEAFSIATSEEGEWVWVLGCGCYGCCGYCAWTGADLSRVSTGQPLQAKSHVPLKLFIDLGAMAILIAYVVHLIAASSSASALPSEGGDAGLARRL